MISAFEQKGIQNAIVGKRGMKFIEFTAKMSKFPNFLYFRQHSPNFGHFPKIYFNEKHHRHSIETSSYRQSSVKISDKFIRTTFKYFT